MRSTVNRTLSEALSENVVTLTESMREMVQQDADAMGLGVEIVTFTVGGMHPPVMVAAEYESVVSAELAKVTAVVNAQAFRNQTVPAAEASVLMSENTARADGAQDLALSSGRGLELPYFGVTVSVCPPGLPLPPPSGDAGEKPRGTQLHSRRFPHPAGWR